MSAESAELSMIIDPPQRYRRLHESTTEVAVLSWTFHWTMYKVKSLLLAVVVLALAFVCIVWCKLNIIFHFMTTGLSVLWLEITRWSDISWEKSYCLEKRKLIAGIEKRKEDEQRSEENRATYGHDVRVRYAPAITLLLFTRRWVVQVQNLPRTEGPPSGEQQTRGWGGWGWGRVLEFFTGHWFLPNPWRSGFHAFSWAAHVILQ